MATGSLAGNESASAASNCRSTLHRCRSRSSDSFVMGVSCARVIIFVQRKAVRPFFFVPAAVPPLAFAHIYKEWSHFLVSLWCHEGLYKSESVRSEEHTS